MRKTNRCSLEIGLSFRNVAEFDERWSQPMDTNEVSSANSYVNPKETQRSLNIFSNVKAATVLPAMDIKEEEGDLPEVDIFSPSI